MAFRSSASPPAGSVVPCSIRYVLPTGPLVLSVDCPVDSTQMEQQLASELGRAPQTKETAEALGMKPAEVSKLRSQLYRSVVLALEHDVDGENGEELNLLDVLPDRANLEPDEQLEGRELYAYLQDAIALLPERHRLVIVGYFLEEKTSVDLARFLGVTESRVSQLRSDAIEMLRVGITSQYDDAPAEPKPAVGPNAAGSTPTQLAKPATGVIAWTKAPSSAPVSAASCNSRPVVSLGGRRSRRPSCRSSHTGQRAIR